VDGADLRPLLRGRHHRLLPPGHHIYTNGIYDYIYDIRLYTNVKYTVYTITYERTVYANVPLVYRLLRSHYYRRLQPGETQKGKKRLHLYPISSGEGPT